MTSPGSWWFVSFSRHAPPELQKLLRVVFGRWPIEDCVRETKEELGLDHFECRGWRCIHQHLFATILLQLFCARAWHPLSPNEDVLNGELLTMEQVRRAANVVVGSLNFPPRIREQPNKDEAHRNDYDARRNAQASKSHRMPRRKRFETFGINRKKSNL